MKVNIVKLYRKFRNVKLVKIDERKIVKSMNVLKRTNFVKGEFSKYIEEFIQRVGNNSQTYNFTLLAKNLKTLKVIIVSELENNNMAVYDASYNIIYIDSNYLDRMDEIIYHELFHMSSTYKDEEECFIGFQRNYLFNSFNEGYTEVLTKRYFGDKSKEKPYLFEMILAEIVEYLIGQEKMEYLYSKGDSLGMLVEFSRYTEKQEDTYITLGNIDRMGEFYDKQEYANCMHSVREIILILIGAFINKCRIICVSLEEVDNFFRLMPLFYTYDDKDFDIFTQEEINEHKKKCYLVIKKSKTLKKELN